MNKFGSSFWSPVNLIILILIIALFGIGMMGLFYPDGIFLKYQWQAGTILLSLQIAVPLLLLITLLFFYRIRSGLTQPGAFIFFWIFLLFLGLLAYPVGEYYYQKSFNETVEKFHPFLQTSPKTNTYDVIDFKGTKIAIVGEPVLLNYNINITDALNKKFGSDSQTKVLFIDYTNPFYNSIHSLLITSNLIRSNKPDIVIYSLGENDLFQNADFSFLSEKIYRPDYSHNLGSVKELVDRKTFLGFLQTSISHLWFNNEEVTYVKEESFPGQFDFGENLRLLLEESARNNIKTFIMNKASIDSTIFDIKDLLEKRTYGNRKMWDKTSYFEGINKYNEIIKKQSSSAKAALIDISGRINKSPELLSGREIEDSISDLITQIIYDEFKRLRLIK